MTGTSRVLRFALVAAAFAFAYFMLLGGLACLSFVPPEEQLPWQLSLRSIQRWLAVFPFGGLFEERSVPIVLALPLNSLFFGIVCTAFVFAVRRLALSLPSRAAAAVVLALVVTSVPAMAGAPENARESTVGIPARITDLVLPGSELEVLPSDAKTPVVLRITRVAPHGTEFRYDFEWTGLDVGAHDLRTYLRRKDGTDVSNLPEIPVGVRTVLGPGLVKPNHPAEREVPRFGGYRAWMIAVGVAWAIGLVAILFQFRKKRADDHASRALPKTLAERLRPLVESAMLGTLNSAERAQLELGLVAYWRRRLELDTARPDEALAALRRHAEAGPLLNQLDAWLYKPGTSGTVDVAALLAPYKDLPPDAIDIELALAAGRR